MSPGQVFWLIEQPYRCPSFAIGEGSVQLNPEIWRVQPSVKLADVRGKTISKVLIQCIQAGVVLGHDNILSSIGHFRTQVEDAACFQKG